MRTLDLKLSDGFVENKIRFESLVDVFIFTLNICSRHAVIQYMVMVRRGGSPDGRKESEQLVINTCCSESSHGAEQARVA